MNAKRTWLRQHAPRIKADGAYLGAVIGATGATQLVALWMGWTPRSRYWIGLGGAVASFAAAAATFTRAPNVSRGFISGGVSAMAMMGAVNPPANTTRPQILPVIYGERGGGIAGAISRALPFVARVQGPKFKGVVLHTVADEFVANGAALNKRMRDAMGPVEIWWQMANDYHQGDIASGRMTVAQLQDLRAQVATVGKAEGIAVLIDDCEPAWTHHGAAFDEAAAAEMVARQKVAGGGTMLIGHTGYGRPSVHMDFPWKGFLGCDLYAWEIYWSGDENGTTGQVEPDGTGPARYLADEHGIELAEAMGVVNPNAMHTVELQVHNCSTSDLGAVAEHFPLALGWNMDLSDPNGRRFMLAMIALETLGYTGAGRIERFQTARKMPITKRFDPATLRALGVN